MSMVLGVVVMVTVAVVPAMTVTSTGGKGEQKQQDRQHHQCGCYRAGGSATTRQKSLVFRPFGKEDNTTDHPNTKRQEGGGEKPKYPTSGIQRPQIDSPTAVPLKVHLGGRRCDTEIHLDFFRPRRQG